MKNECQTCHELKESSKPRLIKKEYVKNEKFNNPILTSRTLIICDDCYALFKEGKLTIDIIRE